MPNRVKNRNTITNSQKKKFLLWVFEFWIWPTSASRINKIIIENKREMTPPNLLGMARKIA